jgi:hypothetical protein
MSAAVDPVGKSDFLSSDRMIGLSDTIFGVALSFAGFDIATVDRGLEGKCR